MTLALDQRAFSYWDTERHGWHVSPDSYEILVGSSSRTIRQIAVCELERPAPLRSRARPG